MSKILIPLLCILLLGFLFIVYAKTVAPFHIVLQNNSDIELRDVYYIGNRGSKPSGNMVESLAPGESIEYYLGFDQVLYHEGWNLEFTVNDEIIDLGQATWFFGGTSHCKRQVITKDLKLEKDNVNCYNLSRLFNSKVYLNRFPFGIKLMLKKWIGQILGI